MCAHKYKLRGWNFAHTYNVCTIAEVTLTGSKFVFTACDLKSLLFEHY
jgi:hypothetical protein